MILYHQRRIGRPVALVRIGDDDVPFHLAVLRVQRDQMTVRRGEIDGVLINSRATVADVERVVHRVLIVPEFLARACVHGPDVVGCSDVKYAVDEYRRSLDRLIPGCLKAPDIFQVANVLRRNLRQLAVALSVVFAVVGEPCIRGWIQ